MNAVTKSAAISSGKSTGLKDSYPSRSWSSRLNGLLQLFFFFLQVLEKSNSYSRCCCSSSRWEKKRVINHFTSQLDVRHVKELISAAVGYNAPNSFEPTKYGGTMFLLFPYHEARNVEIILEISASIISVFKFLQTNIVLCYIYVYVHVFVHANMYMHLYIQYFSFLFFLQTMRSACKIYWIWLEEMVYCD